MGGIFVLTADHGNAEDMAKRDKSGKPLLDKDGKVQTLNSHTLNPVSARHTSRDALIHIYVPACRCGLRVCLVGEIFLVFGTVAHFVVI